MNAIKTAYLPLSITIRHGIFMAIILSSACAYHVGSTGRQDTQPPEGSTINNDPYKEEKMTNSVTPFLMFQGKKAQEAIDFYVDLFPDSRVEETHHYGDSNPDFADWIMFATATIGGQKVRFSDSPIKHAFDFTPSTSFLVECDSEEELRRIAAALEPDGRVLMPIDSYGFSEKFAWVEDRFGVSWQLMYGSLLGAQ